MNATIEQRVVPTNKALSSAPTTEKGREYTAEQQQDILRLLAYRESRAVMDRLKSDIAAKAPTTETSRLVAISEEDLRAIARDVSFSPELIEKTLQDYAEGKLSAEEANLITFKNPLFEKKYDSTMPTISTLEERCVTHQITFIGEKYSTLPSELTVALKEKGYLVGNGWKKIDATEDGQTTIGIIKPQKGLKRNLYIGDITLTGQHTWYDWNDQTANRTTVATTQNWYVMVYGDHISEVTELVKELLKTRPDTTATIKKEREKPRKYHPLEFGYV